MKAPTPSVEAVPINLAFELPKRTEWLPVRCCCQPQKVFGFMRVPVRDIDTRRPLFIPYRMRNGADIGIEIRVFANGVRNEERAIYSDDRPIEFWRQFGEDFIEVPA
jgi:hypothetical protein